MHRAEFVQRLNKWGQRCVPFLFITDFECAHLWASPIDEIDPNFLQYSLNGYGNVTPEMPSQRLNISMPLPPYEAYEEKFKQVQHALQIGHTFLLNLTIKIPIQLSVDTHSAFVSARAKYKLWWRDRLTLFSPESFVRTRQGKIHTYPMKGTISAREYGASLKILNDRKEEAEHITAVDLLRNDLSRVASQVSVSRFRYVEEVTAYKNGLWQVSSEIVGILPVNYRSHLGDVLMSLLPAGSVTGAPKQKTIELIGRIEQEPRGYYTGVFGYFDGRELDSAVMIRFVEETPGQLYYRAGGGITAQSDCRAEYDEILTKVYVPVY